jgi:hypothetical protein
LIVLLISARVSDEEKEKERINKQIKDAARFVYQQID